MDFLLDEEQTMLRDSVRGYLDRSYTFSARRSLVHAGGGFDANHWNVFVEMGWLGAALPEDVGGYGGGAEAAAIILEEFGRALVVEPFLAVGVLAAETLVHAGGDLARDLCKRLITGRARPVLAHNEEGARGEIMFVETRAKKDGDEYRLSGRKTLVIGGTFADTILVSAREAGEASDPDGVSLFAVPVGAPGLSQQHMRLADGTRASEITLRDVVVERAALLGSPGTALEAVAHGYACATVALCAEALGAMDRALWITRDYLLTRQQFGQLIGSFQALQHRMADMLIELELGRSAVYRALAHLDAPPLERDHAVSIAKVQIGKGAKFVGGQSIQLHGGIGVTEDYVIGHYFKRLTFIDNAFGPVQTHLARIARTGAALEAGSRRG